MAWEKPRSVLQQTAVRLPMAFKNALNEWSFLSFVTRCRKDHLFRETAPALLQEQLAMLAGDPVGTNWPKSLQWTQSLKLSLVHKSFMGTTATSAFLAPRRLVSRASGALRPQEYFTSLH